MSKIIINGLNPTAPVPNYVSLVPSLGYTGDVNNRKMMNFQTYENNPALPQALGRSVLMMVKPLQQIETLTKVIRRPPMSNTIGIRPTTGIGRGQSKGLAFDPRHPIDTKIMPQSSNFSAALNNPLGQPK
tara:strand:- start:377 stop:766 length:390 start_codon:yes stop_codon:yes gene_type:complete